MALEEAPRVEVLKFDEKEAYDHDRPISNLIRTQLLHLHYAENMSIPPQARTNTNINHLLTEKQASEYIQRVTRLLHRYGKVSSRTKPKKTATRLEKKTEKKSIARTRKQRRRSP